MAGTGGYQDEEDGGGAISGINVTPLVDITLVLLIIFMVTASLIVNPGIKLDLPKASTGEQVTKTTLAVSLRCENPDTGTLLAQNQLLLDGQPITEDGLKATTQNDLTDNPDITAIIGADTRCEHGQVLHLLDLMKKVGVQHVAESVVEQEDGTPQ
jgi:biopolymer transport protein ExbD